MTPESKKRAGAEDIGYAPKGGGFARSSPSRELAMIIKLPHSLIVLLSDWTGKRIRMVRLFVLTKNRYN